MELLNVVHSYDTSIFVCLLDLDKFVYTRVRAMMKRYFFVR